MRQKAFTIQYGESPYPIKPSKQSVPRLGIEAVRLDLSVVRGVREPQCESVVCPDKLGRR